MDVEQHCWGAEGLCFVEDGVPVLQIVLLILEELCCVVVNGDGGDFVTFAIVFAAGFSGVVFSGDFLDDMHAIGHLAEYGVAVVQERSGCGGDKEL